jgi:hypothetical protein
MTDAAIAVAPDSTGKLIDLQQLTNGSSQTVYRQTTTLGSPTDIGAVQEVLNSGVQPTSDKGAAVVAIRRDTGGSTGLDFSANHPAWPNVGSAFSSGSALYPSWVLLATVPANPSRLNLTVDNMSNTPILCLRDDGTAATGATPVNSTGFTLNPKVSAGPEGGHYETTTFRGRMQFYGASSSQVVAISTD